jgi:hypothetical protein
MHSWRSGVRPSTPRVRGAEFAACQARLAASRHWHRREFRHGTRRRDGLARAPCLHGHWRRRKRRLTAGGPDKTYGVGILVGEATRSRIQDVVFREIDRIRVKGKEEAIAIYEPLEKESTELESWEGGTARLPRAAMGTRHPPRPAAVRLGRHHEIRREIGRRLKCAFVCSVAREGSADAICAQRPSFSTATF